MLKEAKAKPDVETLIVDDMARQIAAAIQDKAFSRDGSSNTPTGLYNSSIGSVSFSSANDPTWAETISVWGKVAGNSALSLPRDQFAWAFASVPAGNMLAKTKDSGSGRFVLDTDMNIMGYPVYISELCTGVTF